MPAIDFRALFEHSPNSYMLLDRQLRYVAANRAYLDITGRRIEDLVGRYVFEVFPHDPEDPANESATQLRQSFERVLSTGQPDVIAFIRYRVPGESGREGDVDDRFWSATHAPIHGADGQVEHILQHTVDVTELQHLRRAAQRGPAGPNGQMEAGVLRRAREVQQANVSLVDERAKLQRLFEQQKIQEVEREALLEREQQARSAAEAAEQRQRFLAESIPQQVWTALPDGRLEFVNRRVVEYFGLPEEAILGDGWRSGVHPDDVENSVERWGQSIRTGDEYEFQFRLRRADGAYRWHLARALALRAPDGRIEKWFGTNTDMDELTRARDELRKRAEFDQQLLGIVSHDLRNPLNAIGVATALLLKRGQLDEQQVTIVSRIMSSSERAVRLIRDFLDFTQARVMGRIPVSPSPANIREIARQVFDEVLLAQRGRQGVIEHDGEEQGIWDPDRIAQVIGNLLSNAFQHSPESSVVRLSTRGDSDGVTIDVHNEGEPIPPRDLARLFEPFERGSDASSTGRSIGLGLYISRQIIAAHGGTISVQSTPEHGTHFTVWLPVGTASRDVVTSSQWPVKSSS